MGSVLNRIIFSSLLAVALMSCRSPDVQNPFLKTMSVIAATHDLKHVQSGCKIFSTGGDLIFQIPYGRLCIFEKDGSTVMGYKGELGKFDAEMKPIWKLHLRTNHQLKSAEFEDAYLTIVDYFYTEKDGKLARYDGLAVINNQGRILKSFNFRNLREQYKSFEGLEPARAELTDLGPALDMTHLNSFLEYYKSENGSKVFAGYIAHDIRSRHLFFFDRTLSKITKMINLSRTWAHDFQQIAEHKLLFYRNDFCFDKSCRQIDPYSNIQILDISDETFSEHYNNRDSRLKAWGCSSVQPIASEYLFIFHAICSPKPHPSGRSATWEIVDLKTRAGFSFSLKTSVIDQAIDAKLVNAENYLKNAKFK